MGVNDLPETDFSFSVSPHPLVSRSVLAFENTQRESYRFTLTDITGRIIETTETHANRLIIERGNKTSGMYMFTLTRTETGRRVADKLVVTDGE